MIAVVNAFTYIGIYMLHHISLFQQLTAHRIVAYVITIPVHGTYVL